MFGSYYECCIGNCVSVDNYPNYPLYPLYPCYPHMDNYPRNPKNPYMTTVQNIKFSFNELNH